MSRSWLLSLLCLCAAVCFVQLSLAQSGFRVDESATMFLIQEQPLVEIPGPNMDDNYARTLAHLNGNSEGPSPGQRFNSSVDAKPERPELPFGLAV